MSDVVIHKVQLHMHRNEIELPLGAEILSVAAQKNNMVMWYLFYYGEKQTIKRVFHVKITGVAFSNRKAEVFLGTILLEMGNFVVHVFEEVF